MAELPQEERRPVPDPTTLTTAALRREIEGLKELLQSQLASVEERWHEKFQGVEKQLEIAERQRVEQKFDTRTSVEAALTAQKDAASKLETTTGKQLDQLSQTFNAGFEGIRRDIDDLKERVGKMETKIT